MRMPPDAATEFAELGAISNFSFLHGASHPQEMVQQAAALGYGAIGVADRNTLSGVVRTHIAAREAGIRVLTGARLITDCGFEHPSDVQQRCIPVAILGDDVLCQAVSGMGKTAVFVLSIL